MVISHDSTKQTYLHSKAVESHQDMGVGHLHSKAVESHQDMGVGHLHSKAVESHQGMGVEGREPVQPLVSSMGVMINPIPLAHP